jgi:hypothetical protein
MKSPEFKLLERVNHYWGLGPEYLPGQDAWKVRMVEVAKVKRYCHRNRVACSDLVLAADYCYAHQIPVTAWQQLRGQILPAVKWDRERQVELRAEELRTELVDAITYERMFGSEEWATRLERADLPHAREVLDEWTSHRQNVR